jgi:hypothetical protein
MTETELRRAAVIATEARFKDRPFDWRKAATCIHLVRFHAAQMGHKLPIVPKFKSALGAKRALLSTGFQTLPALLDSRFQRIPPAFMRVGDVLAMPGDDGFEGLLLKADKVKFLGWHQDATGCEYMEIDMGAAIGAWRL